MFVQNRSIPKNYEVISTKWFTFYCFVIINSIKLEQIGKRFEMFENAFKNVQAVHRRML